MGRIIQVGGERRRYLFNKIISTSGAYRNEKKWCLLVDFVFFNKKGVRRERTRKGIKAASGEISSLSTGGNMGFLIQQSAYSSQRYIPRKRQAGQDGTRDRDREQCRYGGWGGKGKPCIVGTLKIWCFGVQHDFCLLMRFFYHLVWSWLFDRTIGVASLQQKWPLVRNMRVGDVEERRLEVVYRRRKKA